MDSDIRVLVVDDCDATRRLLAHMIAKQGGMVVVGEAQNGEQGLEEIQRCRPDVVTLDLQMPRMDGVATLLAIRQRFGSVPVIVCSAHSAHGARATIEALLAGADDFICKVSQSDDQVDSMSHLQTELGNKIRAVVRGRNERAGVERASETAGRTGVAARPEQLPLRVSRAEAPIAGLPVNRRLAVESRRCEVVVIGTSTGGPAALADLIAALPVDLPVPVAIVQHLTAAFTGLLAQTLARRTQRSVVEAQDGQEMLPGTYYIAPGGRHMEVRRQGEVGTIVLHDQLEVHGCRPAVDVLFRSAAAEFAAECLAVVLTGMGNDGLAGAQAIHERGGRILVQDRASCVVWGMPKHVEEAGIAEAALPLADLPAEILRQVNRYAVVAAAIG